MTLADLIRQYDPVPVNFSIHPKLRSDRHALWDGSRLWVSAATAARIDAAGGMSAGLMFVAEMVDIVEVDPL